MIGIMTLIHRMACIICHRLSPKIKGLELPSPRDIIRQSDITYHENINTVTIHGIKPKVWLTTVADTHSMDGTIDIGHTMILSNNKEYLDKLAIGDIIIWQKYVMWGRKIEFKTIMHQIIKMGQDEKGWFCRTRGINSPLDDPWKIRIEDVKWLALGIIW